MVAFSGADRERHAGFQLDLQHDHGDFALCKRIGVGFGTQLATKLPVAFKFFLEYAPAPHVPEYNEANEQCAKMKYEAIIYQALSKTNINNLVAYVASTRLPWASAKTLLPAAVLQALQLVIPSTLIQFIKFVHISVMERRLHATGFDKVLIQPSMDNARLKALVWQIVFTLAVLNQHHIQHNDLHYGNILVDGKPDEQAITYHLGVSKYKVDVQRYGKVLLFDWDFGYCTKCGHNVALDNYYCQQSGICNTDNPRFDLYTILHYISQPTDKEFNAFKDAVRFGPNHLTVYENFQGRICNINPRVPDYKVMQMKRGTQYTIKSLGDTNWPSCGFKKVTAHVNDDFISSATAACKGSGTVYRKKKINCIPFPAGQPASVLTPLQALKHPYFDSLKI